MVTWPQEPQARARGRGVLRLPACISPPPRLCKSKSAFASPKRRLSGTRSRSHREPPGGPRRHRGEAGRAPVCSRDIWKGDFFGLFIVIFPPKET